MTTEEIIVQAVVDTYSRVFGIKETTVRAIAEQTAAMMAEHFRDIAATVKRNKHR